MSLSKEIKMQCEINTKRHEALLNIVRTAAFIDKLSDGFFSEFNLTEAQYNILIVLKLEKTAMNQVEIGERLISSRANITLILAKLEKKELIQRTRIVDDRRVLMVELTEKGRQVVGRVEAKYVSEVEKRMACLTQAECRVLSRLLEKLRETLRKG
ncbi:MAG: hypothetical protein A2351_08680 [Omnitrophica bacterium RIFOXYB12_FULL_50_7]|nr:MAG: hypothetical protein A2351_08680 [Omnitrophica bacterium RIFOXYB12_FULL_50_7]